MLRGIVFCLESVRSMDIKKKKKKVVEDKINLTDIHRV